MGKKSELIGVPVEFSEGSGGDTAVLLVRRLEEDQFFLKVATPGRVLFTKRAGEVGIGGILSSLVIEVTLLRPGVAGDPLDAALAEEGAGNGDDIWRAEFSCIKGLNATFDGISGLSISTDLDSGSSGKACI